MYLSISGPWIAIGDFNVVLGSHEKKGRGLPSKMSCDDFNDWTNNNLLTNILTKGVQFAWSNGRIGSKFIEKRLDKAVVNVACISFCSNISYSTLTCSKLDHYPLLLSF